MATENPHSAHRSQSSTREPSSLGVVHTGKSTTGSPGGKGGSVAKGTPSEKGGPAGRTRVTMDSTMVAQFEVLCTLARLSADLGSSKGTTPVLIDINRITEHSGLKDIKDVQRYLYILEGHKLATPFPEGDLTSREWQITTTGVEMVRQYNRIKRQANR